MKTFDRYHPAVLMMYFISVLIIAMFVPNPALQLAALLGAVSFGFCLQSPRQTAKTLWLYSPLFFLILLTNPLISHEGDTPLFYCCGFPVTLEASLYGAALAVMIIEVMLWFQWYNRVVTTDKFLGLLGRPFPRLSLVLSMALRFIPLLRRQMHAIRRTQKALGYYSSRCFSDRIRSAMRVFSALLAWSLETAMDVSVSMRARGYGLKNRTTFAPFRFRTDDLVLLVGCLLLLTVTMVGVGVADITFSYYPRVGAFPRSPMAVAVYTAFGILCFLPAMLEWKEALVWKHCVSKI